jgi:protein SCO1/2
MFRRSHLALATAVATLAACAPSADLTRDPHDLPLRGTKPFQPLEKVDFTLTDTGGRPFDFRAETDGKIALLFFGYTFCPDICALHMATLAAALDQVAPEVRDQVVVVFVSVDPDRDTPERLGTWLAAFDSTFVGVRGGLEEVSEALAFYRYPPPETSGEEMGYTVGHPALVYAFAPDNLGRAMYGPETTRAIWAHDLSLLARHDWTPPIAAPTETAAGAAEALRPGITALDAYAPAPRDSTAMAVYVTLQNGGTVPDTLLSVSSSIALRASVHDVVREEGMMRMVRLSSLEIPAGGTVRLEPGGLHGMLEGLQELPAAGANLAVVLRFARAGPVPVAVRVLAYEDMIR